ncbi:hypothetical protein JX265_009883 [Neoarthrinium moseri]|uniref:SET domain-containing protein n=1 Tax=Neoarthrinium moseri TaxID=1658444 RepID=A0A9P9WF90_9PEZI|nr:hypothetical protein JX265_009883 [Neoarthrinium moseri]
MCRLFEILNTPQSGSGAFATRDIPVGTVILREKALRISPRIKFVDREDQLGPYDPCIPGLEDLMDAYDGLTREKKEQVLELSSHRPERGRSPDTREQYLQLWFATRTNSFIEDDAGYRSRIPDKSFPNLLSLAITRVALFTVASRFNHSCAHNALHAVEAGFIELRARCDIREGKEITLTYIDPWVEDRAAQLERSWGFRCCCPICDESNTTMSPEVRGNYEKMFKQLQYWRNGDPLSGFAWVRRHARRLEALEFLGCSYALLQEYVLAADAYEYVGDIAKKEHSLEAALEMAVLSCGHDHDTTQRIA